MTDVTWRALPPGARVVVRRRLSPAEAEQARSEGRGAVWTDIIAVVLEVSDAGLRLRTDAPREPVGREVFVPAGEIETAKQIPPRPQRRTGA